MMTMYLCDARVFDVGSFTDELKVYRVVLPTDPAVSATCDCPAFTYRKVKSGSCKHIDNVRWTLEDDGFPELLRPNGKPLRIVDGAGTGFSFDDIVDLFERALTWVDNDGARAALLVKAYIAGTQR